MVVKEIHGIKFAASAGTPRRYRKKFGKDIYKDFAEISKDLSRQTAAHDDSVVVSSLSPDTLEAFENIAYIMALQADPKGVPDNPDDWLDSIDGTFSFWMILPQLMELWGLNVQELSVPKKNPGQAAGK